ncbi:restriction endonuclease subunit S [Elizabethkingia anophelis]|uniref:restriction endonuclease subunit S n=1 Tax=Elizabethkingia anophelis TaxID=1117645 RepID=UPI001EE6E869|nr:restriction endonuclease subunit S [Elizabethkingia anophelis]UKY85841.1 restriction endonuclease subunit S [Elizabethkingia anophelis]UKY99953.1 restriction endonuclease subunit S [Elizabethkingia anophelis]
MTISFTTLRYKNLSNWSVAHLLANQFNYNEDFKLERIGNFLYRNKTQITVEDDTFYKRVTIRLYNKGVKLRDTEIGRKIGTKKQYLIKEGQFLMSKIDARNGAFGIATNEVDGAIITADFFAYDIDETKIIPQFLVLLTTTNQFMSYAQSASSGTTGRQRIDEKKFLDVKIPLPSVKKQRELIDNYNQLLKNSTNFKRTAELKEEQLYSHIAGELGLKITTTNFGAIFKTIKYRELFVWSVADLLKNDEVQSNFPLKDLKDLSDIIMGNSPSSKELNTNGIGFKFIGGAADIVDNVVISKRYIDNSSKLSKPGDIIYLIRATIGNPFIADDNYYLGRGVAVIRSNEQLVLAEYLLFVLKLIEENIIMQGTGSTFKQISKPILEKIKIPVPSMDFQNNIITTIKKEMTLIKELKVKYIETENQAKMYFEQEIFK